MIPHIIHYCWFGRKPLPPLAIKCIESWKKYLPDYEIKEWNEDNFNINIIPYTQEAYKKKRYAFVSDFARFWILYHYGGIYFDTDVEVIRPMDNIIHTGAFMGFENGGSTVTGVAPGLGIGTPANQSLYKEFLDHYAHEHFINEDGSQNLRTVVDRVTSILGQYGLQKNNQLQDVVGVRIYPSDYFCPIRITDGKLFVTTNTVSIHHYAASWTTPTHRLLRKFLLAVGGVKLKMLISSIFRNSKL